MGAGSGARADCIAYTGFYLPLLCIHSAGLYVDIDSRTHLVGRRPLHLR